MIKLRILLFAIAVLAMGGILISLNGCGGSSGSPTPPSSGKIKHVVVIFQENRTPDNLFQDQTLITRGADIAQQGTDSHGNTITLKEVGLAVDYDPGHGHNAFIDMCQLNSAGQCQMNGADLVPITCNKGATDCPAPDLRRLAM